jgi:EmrB/QacA subfamily drug resistance transporter
MSFLPQQQFRVPLIVAAALFMENLDSTVITTALPAIARSMNEDLLRLNLAVTSYLLSLAVFIPLSGWVADRYGARTVFRTAIAVFTIGSLLCGVSHSALELVAARVLQGIGGAMMVPVGRLVILRTVRKSELVQALSYLTIPALIGPIIGPPLGGFLSTYASWRWIFFINLPIGLLGIYLATRFLENIKEPEVPPLDLRGSILSGIGLAGLVFGFETVDRGALPGVLVAGLLALGALCLVLYVIHARITTAPIIDLSLLRIPTFSLATIGGTIFRIGMSGMQLLLPLMLQLGFGLSPFASGLLTFAGAAGSMPMKVVAPFVLRNLGFRKALVGAAFINGVILIGYSFFTPHTPHLLIFVVILSSGFVRSLQFTATNAITFADVSSAAMSRATSFSSMAQQLSASLGVATGAFILHEILRARGGIDLAASDFSAAFVILGIIAWMSGLCFLRLSPQAGSEVSGVAKPVSP